MSTSGRRDAARDGLFIVGLTGRAGSGKSTVAKWFEARGATVIDADALGHEVTDRDPRVREALVAEYGPQVYGRDGRLDRGRVAERVFRDPEARARLDRLVHPRIVELIRARLRGLRAAGFRGLVVIDAALMLEWGLEGACDALVAVTAPETEQIARLMRARGWSEVEVGRRLAAQRGNAQFEEAADITIRNQGDLRDLEKRVQGLVNDFQGRLEARERAPEQGPC